MTVIGGLTALITLTCQTLIKKRHWQWWRVSATLRTSFPCKTNTLYNQKQQRCVLHTRQNLNWLYLPQCFQSIQAHLTKHCILGVSMDMLPALSVHDLALHHSPAVAEAAQLLLEQWAIKRRQLPNDLLPGAGQYSQDRLVSHHAFFQLLNTHVNQSINQSINQSDFIYIARDAKCFT